MYRMQMLVFLSFLGSFNFRVRFKRIIKDDTPTITATFKVIEPQIEAVISDPVLKIFICKWIVCNIYTPFYNNNKFYNITSIYCDISL